MYLGQGTPVPQSSHVVHLEKLREAEMVVDDAFRDVIVAFQSQSSSSLPVVTNEGLWKEDITLRKRGHDRLEGTPSMLGKLVSS